MSTFYLNYEEMLQCAEILKNHFPIQTKNIIETADQSIKNLFMIPETMAADRWVDLGNPIDWLMNPTEDPEFTWILNRHEHMVCLGKSYLLTGDEVYSETFKNHIIGWINQNPVPTDVSYNDAIFFQQRGPWRLLEVGLRVQSWILAYELLQKSAVFTPDFLNKFFDSLSEHADYLCNYLGNTEINHATMHMQGLFMVSVVLDFHPRSAYWRQLATERLELCLLHQIDEDGVQIELSTHYHNASIMFFGTPYVLAQKSGFPFSSWYKEKLKSIAAYTQATIRPDGISSPISDSNWSEDAPDLLGFIGLALEDEYYLGIGSFSEPMLWMFGPESYEKYKTTAEKKALEIKSSSFPCSGYYVMKDAVHYLFFDAAQMGGAHGHADILNFEWMWNNQLIFSDLGCYTYEEGDMRRYFKSTRNHNTVAIDDMDQTPYFSSQKWDSPIAKPNLYRFYNKDDYFFIDASHDGYKRLSHPITHRRWLLLVKSFDLLIIVDWLEGEGSHSAKQHFNLSKDAFINRNDKTVNLSYPSSNTKMRMQWWTANNEDDINIINGTGWISKKYAFKEEIPVIDATLSFDTKACIVTVCNPYHPENDKNLNIHSVKIDVTTKTIDIAIDDSFRNHRIYVSEDAISLTEY